MEQHKEKPREKQFEKQSDRNLSLLEPKEKQFVKIRIKIAGRFLFFLDKVVADILRNAQGMHLPVCGPIALPTVVIECSSRLAPSPQGINLVRHYEMHFHERVIDVVGTSDLIEQIIAGVDDHYVNINVEVVDLGSPIQ